MTPTPAWATPARSRGVPGHDRGAPADPTFLFITHDLSLAWGIADRTEVIYLGKIMQIGPAERAIRSPRNPYTQAPLPVSPSPDPPTPR